MDTDDRRDHFKIALRQLADFPYKETMMYGRTVDDSLQYLITAGRLADARRLRDTLKLDRPEGWPTYTIVRGRAHSSGRRRGSFATRIGDRAVLSARISQSFADGQALAAGRRRSELSRGRRALFVRAAWSRDYAMGRVISRAHDKLLRTLAPEITDTWQTPAGRQREAWTTSQSCATCSNRRGSTSSSRIFRACPTTRTRRRPRR